MCSNSVVGESANDVLRCCKKNSLSVLSCIGKRTKEGCDHFAVFVVVVDFVYISTTLF